MRTTAAIVCLGAAFCYGSVSRAEDPNAILDLLEHKGLITHDEAAEARKYYDKQQQEKPAAIVPASVTNTPAPFVIPLGKETKLVLGGFIQGNGEFGDVSAFEGNLPGATNALNKTNHRVFDRFRLRRARINVSGDFLENFDFKVEGDFSQGDGLGTGNGGTRTAFSATDVFVNWHQFPEANLKLGQFKAPFGLEQITPDTVILTAERSLPTGALTPERQIGIQLWGKPLATIWPQEKELLTYYAGMFNGNDRNITVNDNNGFMYVGRVELVPYEGKLMNQDTLFKLGADILSVQDGTNVNVTQTGALVAQPDGSLKSLTTLTARGERLGYSGDATLTVGPLTLIGEYLQVRYSHELVKPDEFTANGYLVTAGYYIIPKKLQLVGKWEVFRPDQIPSDDIRSVTGGLNYYIKGDNIKVMLDYIHTWSHFRELNPSLGNDQFDEFLARLQLMF